MSYVGFRVSLDRVFSKLLSMESHISFLVGLGEGRVWRLP